MGNLARRIRHIEEAAKAQHKFAGDCICFPENEWPFFNFPVEQELAGKVKCPLHGERLKSLIHIYVPKWHRDKQEQLLWAIHSEQYRKAWFAGFPRELWPAAEEESEDGTIFLNLKNGTKLEAYKPTYERRL
jgi:hypothetical protein